MRQHGTYTCYRWGPEPGQDWRRGCRCLPCTDAAVLYNKLSVRRRINGIDTLFDNTEAREHLEFLRANGVGLRTVAEQSGVGRTALMQIINGRTKRARAETIAKILAVGTHVRAPGALVDATRTWELIDDMLRYGYTKGDLARRLGSEYDKPALQISGNMVLQSTADKVAELHAQLVGTERELMRARRAKLRQRRREGAA